MHIPSLRDLNRSLHLSTKIEKLQAELASIFGGIVHAIVPEEPKKRRRRRKAKRQSAKATPAPVAAEVKSAPRKKAKTKRKSAARKPKMEIIGRTNKAAEVRARVREVVSGNSANTVAPVASEPKARRVSKKSGLVPVTRKKKKTRAKKA